MADIQAARAIINVTTNAGKASASLAKLNAQLGGAQKQGQKAKDGIDKSGRAARNAQKSFKGASTSLSALKTGFAGLVAALGVRELIQLSDTYTEINNKLKLVTKGTADLEKKQKQLFTIAQKSRSSFQSTAELYARLSRSTKTLGVSEEKLLKVTDAINKSFIVSGASSEEASNAIRQLAQGLAAGALRGDEFNSVAEQAPRLQQAIAESLGVTVGELRSLAAEGKITGEVIVNALSGQAKKISDEFAQLAPTTGQSLERLKNTAIRAAGGLSDSLAPAIADVTDAFIDSVDEGGAFALALQTIGFAVIKVAQAVALVVRGLDLLTKVAKSGTDATVAIGKASEKYVVSGKKVAEIVDLAAKGYVNLDKQIASASANGQTNNLRLLLAAKEASESIQASNEGITKSIDDVAKATSNLVTLDAGKKVANDQREIRKEVGKTAKSVEESVNLISAKTNETIQFTIQQAQTVVGIFSNLAQVQRNLAEQRILDLEAQAQKADEAGEREIQALIDSGATQAQVDEKRAEIDNEKALRDAELANKRKQLQRKAAQDQKKFNRFSIVLDTAAAVVSALATVKPFIPAGVAAAGLAAASGATQLAVNESTPIPSAQFGGQFTVPPGNQADSGLVRVNQGETVNVTPTRESGRGNGMPKQLILNISGQEFKGYLTELLNNIVNSGNFQIRREAAIKVS